MMDILKRIWETIKGWFSKKDVVIPIAGVETATSKPIKRRDPRKPRAVELSSMSDLLDNLDETFHNLRLPFGRMSWVTKSEATGLRKLGVHCVHPGHQWIETHDAPANRILPAMFCVSFGWSRKDNSGSQWPAVIFGIKQSKLPAGVSKQAGQHYLFGLGLKVGVDGAQDTNKELFWVGAYITVRTDGTLHVHQELRTRELVIPILKPSMRRKFGGARVITTRQWGRASLAEIHDRASEDMRENICKSEFAQALHWWLKREENWNVAVKKNGERITFAVPKELTSKFFKDRIKVTNKTGATRRIVHYVNGHDRAVGDDKVAVKAHIRGIADFEWKGYSCHVTAPKFNGRLSTDFVIPAEHFSEEDALPDHLFVDISKLGVILANREDGVAA